MKVDINAEVAPASILKLPAISTRVNTFNDDTRKLGIDSEELSACLLKHLANQDESFKDLDLASFATLIREACPQYASKVPSLWKVVCSSQAGSMDFKQLSVVLMSGRSKHMFVMWKEKEYSTKSEVIDKGHQRLFGIINLVASALASCRADIETVVKAIEALRVNAVYNFNREAAMLRGNLDYPKEELDKHMAEHASFIRKVSEFEAQLAKQNVAALCKLASGDLMSYVFEWLANHIQCTDIQLHTFFPNGIP